MKAFKMQIVLGLFASLMMVSLATKPNIIMIMADDLGWNDVGFHGSEIATPNIDALAASGVVLNNYYTAPNCGPSRAQFLTGKYLTHLGLQHKNLMPCRPSGIPLSETTIADELRTFGYRNHLIGKWHAGFHTPRHVPTARGFDTFRGMHNGQGDHYTHQKGFKGYKILDFFNDTLPNPDAYNVYSTDYYKERAFEVIEEHSRSRQPMFMFLSFQAPHTPNQAPQRYIDKYAHIPHQGRQTYAAMVTAMDDAIGAVVAKLFHTNMFNNTVIVFSTDNGGQALSGGASNYPLRGNKGNYYEAGIKGVAFISSPLLKNYGASEALVHITDWKPTFVHLAGGKLHGHDGVNQWNTLGLGGNASRTEIIHNIDPLSVLESGRALRQGRRRRFQQTTSTTTFSPTNGFSTPIVTTSSPSTFDLRQLSVIRSGDWKLMSGEIGYNKIIPNPRTNMRGYYYVNRRGSRSSSVRLFNIREDPTESNDLSRQRLDIVNILVRKLIVHQATAVPVFYPPNSRDCAPRLYNNIFAWGPYKS